MLTAITTNNKTHAIQVLQIDGDEYMSVLCGINSTTVSGVIDPAAVLKVNCKECKKELVKHGVSIYQ